MYPDDETREPGETPDEPIDDGAGEHELPPSTWAGRERADGDEPPADEPATPEPAEPESGGFTEEFNQIGADLDAELEGLDDDEDGEEPVQDEELVVTPEPEAEAEKPEPTAEESEPEETAAKEPDADEAEAAPADPGATVEAETVLPDEPDSAEEKALAGLRARTGEKWDSETNVEKEAVAAGVAAVAGGEAEDEEGAGKPPRPKALWARFLVASMLIVGAMAAATSISLLVYLTDIAEGLSDNNLLGDKVDELLPGVEPGGPQNILILGSDERLDLPGDRRSDTTILLRVDPEQDAISLLSIPRDLRVSIPNHGIDKFNAAYSFGGPKLTLRVVKQLTGIPINHLVNINFTGFADAVNAIDCVYIDVDRRYFIPAELDVAEIDIEAGYQRLCGFYALQYVRYRHDDNDLIRAARQQDFLREARQKVPPEKLVEDREELLEIFTDHTTSDIDDPITLLELLKTFVEARNAELREVHFPADLGDGTTGYVYADEKAIKDTVATFMGVEGTPGPPEAGESAEPEEEEAKPDGGGDGDKGEKTEEPPPEDDGPAMDDATAMGEQYANQISKVKTRVREPMVEFPIFYPTLLVPGSTINSATRAFPIDGPGDEEYRGYKMVVDVPGDAFGNGLLEEYYGISGTDWEDPPILANPSEIREIDGREYMLFYDGDRLRLVGWHEKRGSSYWINNTLSQSLSEEQMLEIAVSARQLDG